VPAVVASPTNFDGITVPDSLLNVIATAVPADVLGDLMNPASRASLASEFHAGRTPDWFQALPTEVKNYFSSVAARMTSDGVVLPTSGPLVTGPLTIPTAAPTEAEATRSSSGLGSRPTGAVAGGLALAAGILGVAIIL
jgi:hypothetical protein